MAQGAAAEQPSTGAAAPKSFAPGQTVCNEKNEKGKLCNGHLKQTNTAGEDALKHLRGEDVLFRCQSCGVLYMGPPLGHVRDPRTQTRFVERELIDILNAAGGTLPAFRLNERGAYVPASEAAHGHAPAAKPAATPAATPAAAATPAQPAEPEETPEQKRARKKAEAEARKASAVPIPGASGPPPEGETPEQKRARLAAVVAEAKRRKEAAAAGAPVVPADIPPAAAPPASPTSGTDSSPAADAHRPAAEAQAATGVASAVPLSSAAATASPAAGAETAADLATDAPKAAKAKPEGGSHSGFKVPPELLPQPGETPEQKLARLRATVEAAKRAAGKL